MYLLAEDRKQERFLVFAVHMSICIYDCIPCCHDAFSGILHFKKH